jgi:crotonobetainyl-CoA:carnitine CoA-transferase CaiB-like acyl-CoA transferase
MAAVTGALDGVRVLQLADGVAGSVAGMLLADLGADVVTVRNPGTGPSPAQPGLHMWDRNKRAVTFHRTSAQDLVAVGRLVEGADVVLVGTTGDLPTYDELRGRGLSPQSGASWVVLPPYVLGHTPWAGGEASAGLLFAGLGQGWSQASWDDRPVDCLFQLSLHMQGVWAATVSVASLVGAQGDHRMPGPAIVGGAHGAMLTSPGGFFVARDDPHVHRPGGPGGVLPNYRCYRCADGQWLFFGAFTNAFIGRGIEAVGAGHILADERVGGAPGNVRLPDNVGWIREELEALFAQRPRDEWLELLEAADVPAAPVLTTEVWLDHAQVQAMGLRHEVRNDAGETVVTPGVLIGLSETPPMLRSPAPATGPSVATFDWPARVNDTAIRDESARRPVSGSRPLAGIRVVDLGTIIAGPYLATLLSELGADVVKVERPPHGDEFRVAHGGRGGVGFSVYNRGQRGVVFDLAASDGLDAFGRLVDLSDVVVDNYRPDVADRLGISFEHLRQINERVSSVSISAFGADGPLGGRPGFDPVVQAMSGIMRSQGGPDESESPVFLTAPVNDVVSAALGALGACAALFARGRSGRGQQVKVTLCAAASLLQSERLVRFAGRLPCGLGDRDFSGPGPLDRLYRCADGWIRLAARPEHGVAVRAALGPGGDATGDLEEDLARALTGQSVAEVLAALFSAGIPAVEARQAQRLVDDDVLVEHGLLTVLESEGGQADRIAAGCWVEFLGLERPAPGLAPLLDEHGEEILREIGADKR